MRGKEEFAACLKVMLTYYKYSIIQTAEQQVSILGLAGLSDSTPSLMC